MKIKFWITLLSFFFWVQTASSASVNKNDGALIISKISTAELQDLFARYNFDEFDRMKLKVPRIYLKTLPSDWKDFPEGNIKNRLFIKILLPLVLKVNEQISKERADLEKISDKLSAHEELSEKEKKFVEEKAAEYDVFTPAKDESRIPVLLLGLMENVDVLPPSIIIAAAGIYSDWGTSRLALEGNSLFREELWYTDEGLAPNENKDSEYRYKTFKDLEECLASYMLKMNSHVNYKSIRYARKVARKMNKRLYGQQIVAQMLFDSNLQNISGLINYTFSYYKLHKTDYYPELENIR